MKNLIWVAIFAISLQPAISQISIKGIKLSPLPAIDTPAFVQGPIKIEKPKKWRMDRNKWITGGLMFTAGAAKGFNEILQFNYRGFAEVFPNANKQWFCPLYSYKNKYKDHDPSKGPRFPFSTSLLVMFTDQYHLNNFIQRASITAALVIKIGEGKKPFRHYVFDIVYYTACYQVGFNTVYLPMKVR